MIIKTSTMIMCQKVTGLIRLSFSMVLPFFSS